MNILFLTDNFPPETNAPASRTYEHARRWVANGHRVTVVTGFPNFPHGRLFDGYRNVARKRETIDGIEVVRMWTYITANEGFFKRSLDYASFMVAAVIAGFMEPRPHIVVATSPQFFAALAGYLVSLVKRRPFVFELRDLWPDSIVTVGAMRESRLINLMRKLEYFLYRRAAAIISVTHSFKRVLTQNGIDPQKIFVVPNGVDPDIYRPGDAPASLRQQLGLDGKFVAAYIGTLGMAHGLESLLRAAKELERDDDIRIVIVGTGAEKDRLVNEAVQLGLRNVVFVGAVSKAQVKNYWRLCDVALVLLKDQPLFSHVIPSKIFEAMGTARPVILAVRGESSAIIEQSGGGVAVPPEDATALACAIVEMKSQPSRRRDMGAAARSFVETEYNRRRLADDMLAVLSAVCAADTPAEVCR
jgi:glycosyltransferase involved in cell wall biosynthesis